MKELILTIILSIIIVVSLLLIFSFKFFVFNFPLFYMNFGHYSDKIVTDCYTENDKCTEIGYSTTYKYCIKNKNNGRGCLNKNTQSFSPKIENNSCLPSCKKYVWKTEKISKCIISNVSSMTGIQTITKKCVINDQQGTNNCIVEKSQNNVIKKGCSKNDGFTYTCENGSTYEQLIDCSI